jgi:hypothetical protein
MSDSAARNTTHTVRIMCRCQSRAHVHLYGEYFLFFFFLVTKCSMVIENIIVHLLCSFRFQRAQEERSRRNPTRYLDESALLVGNDLNSIYHTDAITNPVFSSSSSGYIQRGNPLSYMTNNSSSMGHPHAASLNTYGQHPNMLGTMNGSTPAHLAYFSGNPV